MEYITVNNRHKHIIMNNGAYYKSIYIIDKMGKVRPLLNFKEDEDLYSKTVFFDNINWIGLLTYDN